MRIMAEQCETCIFRPGNLMHLRTGRVASMVRACQREDSYIVCHDTLPHDSKSAACRGYLDTGARPQLLRISERLGIVRLVKGRDDEGRSVPSLEES